MAGKKKINDLTNGAYERVSQSNLKFLCHCQSQLGIHQIKNFKNEPISPQCQIHYDNLGSTIFRRVDQGKKKHKELNTQIIEPIKNVQIK